MSAYYDEFTRWLLTGTNRPRQARGDGSSPADPRDLEAPAATRESIASLNFAPVVSATEGPPLPARQSARGRSISKSPTGQIGIFSTTATSMSHPGEILARYLEELGLTASDLARDVDVPVNRITGILNGQRGVTADTALRLGHWFGVEPSAWLELQLQYELTQAQSAAGAKIRKLPTLADRKEA